MVSAVCTKAFDKNCLEKLLSADLNGASCFRWSSQSSRYCIPKFAPKPKYNREVPGHILHSSPRETENTSLCSRLVITWLHSKNYPWMCDERWKAWNAKIRTRVDTTQEVIQEHQDLEDAPRNRRTWPSTASIRQSSGRLHHQRSGWKKPAVPREQR